MKTPLLSSLGNFFYKHNIFIMKDLTEISINCAYKKVSPRRRTEEFSFFEVRERRETAKKKSASTHLIPGFYQYNLTIIES